MDAVAEIWQTENNM